MPFKCIIILIKYIKYNNYNKNNFYFLFNFNIHYISKYYKKDNYLLTSFTFKRSFSTIKNKMKIIN